MQSTSSEPAQQFRGTWTPAEIHYLLRDGTITTTEFVLLAIIDSLVDVKNDRGCFASNSYLAKASGYQRRWIIKTLKSLESKELIIRKEIDGCRYIWTCYSLIGRGVHGRTPPLRTEEHPPLYKEKSKEKKANAKARSLLAPTNKTTKDKGMPFFKTDQKQIPTENDFRCAEILRKSVLENSGRKLRWSKTKWANEFRLLRESFQEDGATKVLSATEAYVEYVKKVKGLPTIVNAEQFRKHYLSGWIPNKIEKYQRDHPVALQATQDGIAALKAIKMRKWRSESLTQLPQAVEESLKYHEEVRRAFNGIHKRFKDVYNQNPKRMDPMLVYLNHIRQSILSTSSQSFVVKWFLRIHDDVSQWKKWDGSLRPFVFSLDCSFFRRMSWAGGEQWDKLAVLLKQEMVDEGSKG